MTTTTAAKIATMTRRDHAPMHGEDDYRHAPPRFTNDTPGHTASVSNGCARRSSPPT